LAHDSIVDRIGFIERRIPTVLMETWKQIVTTIPLEFLWTDEEQVEAFREKYLTSSDLTEMLKMYPVEFFVADIGTPLKRIAVHKCYEFWKSEVKSHLLNPHEKVDLSAFRGGYGYLASEWSGHIEVPIVLLEKIHQGLTRRFQPTPAKNAGAAEPESF
jgi:hypothetical protein